MPNLRYVPVLSKAVPEDNWRGRTGFVHLAVMEDFADLSGHQVYACGAPIVVDSAKQDYVAQRGLPEDEFLRMRSPRRPTRRCHVAIASTHNRP